MAKSLTARVSFQVAGVSYPNPDGSSRQRIIADSVGPGSEVSLSRDRANGFSENAVRILCRGRQIGFVPEEHAGRFARYLDRDFAWSGRVLNVSEVDDECRFHGVTVEFAFWNGVTPKASGHAPRRAIGSLRSEPRSGSSRLVDSEGVEVDLDKNPTSLIWAVLVLLVVSASLIGVAIHKSRLGSPPPSASPVPAVADRK